jgi:hypothetical protein
MRVWGGRCENGSEVRPRERREGRHRDLERWQAQRSERGWGWGERQRERGGERAREWQVMLKRDESQEREDVEDLSIIGEASRDGSLKESDRRGGRGQRDWESRGEVGRKVIQTESESLNATRGADLRRPSQEVHIARARGGGVLREVAIKRVPPLRGWDDLKRMLIEQTLLVINIWKLWVTTSRGEQGRGRGRGGGRGGEEALRCLLKFGAEHWFKFWNDIPFQRTKDRSELNDPLCGLIAKLEIEAHRIIGPEIEITIAVLSCFLF